MRCMAKAMLWDCTEDGATGSWQAARGGLSVHVNLKRREVRTIMAVDSTTNEDCDVAGAALNAIGITRFDSITQAEPGYIHAVARMPAAAAARFAWHIP
jgi:hypothetical protein